MQRNAAIWASLLISTFLTFQSNSKGAGIGTSGGLTLTQPSGARAFALGEAFVAAQNDITALSYNPASLQSLRATHASFQYNKGFVDDSYGQLMIGKGGEKKGLGLSVSYYNGGQMELNDGLTSRTVTAKKDLTLIVGGARAFKSLTLGGSGKYLSSDLAETAKASAYAFDLGAAFSLSSRLNFGASIQNIGSALKYSAEGDNLPRLIRGGLAYGFIPGRIPATLFLSSTYMLNEKAMVNALGLEFVLGPLALRGGYKTGAASNELTIGTGFMLDQAALDYSFGFINDLDTTHRLSVSMRFGQALPQPMLVNQAVPIFETTKHAAPEPPKVEKPGEPIGEAKEASERTVSPITSPVGKAQVTARKRLVENKTALRPKFYWVKEGDTLESIAEKFYGTKQKWTLIYDKNEAVINNPNIPDLTGQKLVIP